MNPSDLVGGYTLTSGEKYGAAIPDERVVGAIVRFTEDSIVVVDNSKTEVYAAGYTLDGDRITMTSTHADSTGEVAEGLIAKEGDIIKLIYALPGGARPTEFRTGPQQLMFVMENKNK